MRSYNSAKLWAFVLTIVGATLAAATAVNARCWCRYCNPAPVCGSYVCAPGCGSVVYTAAPYGYYEGFASEGRVYVRDPNMPYSTPRVQYAPTRASEPGEGFPQDDYYARAEPEAPLWGRSTRNEPINRLRPARAEDEISIRVLTPDAARVWVNDRRTKARGDVREFTSVGAEPESSYKYAIRAQIERGGRKVTKEKVLTLRSGDATTLRFDFQDDPKHEIVSLYPAAQNDWLTHLTLHVPADSRLWLAGVEMKQTGPVRQFESRDIPAQGQWTDYPVRVEINRDGAVVQQQTQITLRAGQSHELKVDPADLSQPPLPPSDDEYEGGGF